MAFTTVIPSLPVPDKSRLSTKSMESSGMGELLVKYFDPIRPASSPANAINNKFLDNGFFERYAASESNSATPLALSLAPGKYV